MTAPRLEIRLDRLGHNARTVVDRLGAVGIAVTGVTKATLGSVAIARELIDAGASGIGESRIENIESLRRGGITAPITLIRSPMLSQVSRVVAHADVSLNTELAVIEGLSAAAQRLGRTHGVVLMVELGDLREGIMPADMAAVAASVVELPGVTLRGIGANLACQSGIAPDATNMGVLSELADSIEARLGRHLAIVSGGNSANLQWALTGDTGRVNDLRLGESVLLGRDPLDRRAIEGLQTDCFCLVAEVIESKVKPTVPWGAVHQTAFGAATPTDATAEHGHRAILAIGRQDVDPNGLSAPAGVEIIGSSSDHLVASTSEPLVVGQEVAFAVTGYGALLAAMTSPFVEKVCRSSVGATTAYLAR